MKRSKKVECCSSKSLSLSDSCSNISHKTNWKESLYEHQNLFHAAYIAKIGHESDVVSSMKPESDFQKTFRLSSVKNEPMKEISLTVNSMDRYRFGRRSSIIESMLGFRAIPFVDSMECLMVAEIIDNSLKTEYPFLKEGDWFMFLENIEVRSGNIDKLLMQYTKATKVTLVFKGSCQYNIEKENSIQEVTNFNDYTHIYKHIYQTETTKKHNGSSFLTLILNKDYFNGDKDECIFVYPHSSQNFLYKAKGSFLTLDLVLKNDLLTKVLESTIIVDYVNYYVTYNCINSFLVISAYALTFQNKKSAKTFNNDFANFIKIHASTLNLPKTKKYLSQICDIMKLNIENKNEYTAFSLNLEAYFQASLCLALPKEAQLRVQDALSELQSMDFKKWSESQKTSRDLIVCGTSLYYCKYLIMSDIPPAFRTVIEGLLRIRGIFDFLSSQNVKEMFIWEKINELEVKNTHYLAVCVHNNLLLTVVLKNTVPTVSNLSCISYMEEILDTIQYLISCGIESISQFWVDSNNRPSTNLKVNTLARDKYKLHQKHSSTETLEGICQCDSPSQTDERQRKKGEQESTFDWQAFTFRNEYKEADQNPHYIEPLLNEINNMVPMNLTAGWSNNLIYYFHVNVAEAEVLHSLKSICPNFHLSIIKYYISTIHKVLQSTSNIKAAQDSSLVTNKNCIVIKEHSVTIDILNNLGVKESITIIGRLFTFPLKEVYVCFGQNVSQNLVELSFRMSFLSIG